MTDETLIFRLRMAPRAIAHIDVPDHNDTIDLFEALVDAKKMAVDALLLRSDREKREDDVNE